jgi:hypothetical protein
MVRCLVSKCEAQSSNPSTTKTARTPQNIKLYLTRTSKTLLMKEKPGNWVGLNSGRSPKNWGRSFLVRLSSESWLPSSLCCPGWTAVSLICLSARECLVLSFDSSRSGRNNPSWWILLTRTLPPNHQTKQIINCGQGEVLWPNDS